MQHRRGVPVGGHEARRVDRDLALLQVPVGPHRPVAGDGPVRRGDVEPRRQAEHVPQLRDPRPDGDDHVLDGDRAAVGGHGRHGAGAVELEAGDLDARGDPRAGALGLVGQAVHGLAVEGEAAGTLVEAYGESGRPPVGVERAHVRGDLGLAGDQLGRVAEPLLTLGDRGQVGHLRGGAERDVARAVVVQRLGVGLPDLHAGRHQLGHGRLEVVVAYDTAGDAGRTGRHPRLVDHQHVLAALGEVPRRREAVDAGADDEVGDGGG